MTHNIFPDLVNCHFCRFKRCAMDTFFQLYRKAFVQPKRAFFDLFEHPRMMAYTFRAVLIMAVLYTFVYVFLIFGDGRPFKPWLDIPEDVYYRYNVFFCAPSMVLGWILAAGVVHALTRVFTKQGTFEQALVVVGFGIGVASWATGLHDLLTSFLGAVHVINQQEYEHQLNSPTVWRTLLWVQMILYLVWFIALYTIGFKQAYGLKTGRALLLGILAFVMYQGFFLIFNR